MADSTPALAALWGALGVLSDAQVDAYLRRIGLEPSEIRARPLDLALLSTLQLAHMLTVPYTNVELITSLDEPLSDEPLCWRNGPGLPCEVQSAFRRVVEQCVRNAGSD